MDDKNKKDDKKTNEEIRKEIEHLEQLIDKVKEDQQRKKRQNGGPRVLKINLAAIYSRNLYFNFIIGFLINYIAFFALTKILGHLFISGNYNDLDLLAIVLGFTVFEELYKKYLFKKHMAMVVYSVGSVFLLMNVLFLYIVDYLFFDFRWFIGPVYPILFILIFVLFRYVIKILYKQTEILVGR